MRPCALARGFLLASAGESLGGSDTQEIQEEGGEVMANPKNVSSLAELKERFADTDSIVITEYRGLTVAQITELRRSLGADVQYSVAKNTLLKLAAKEAGVEGLDDLLSGPTAIAFIKGEAVDAAKAMKKFASNNKAFVVKGGYMDGDALNADQVNAIAELDNRETTLAKLAGAMKGNLAKAAGLFNAPASQVARLGAALQEKKEA
ncbi:50S ribosomal protein L10 [Corynebacterium pseudotuberculosis]|nr:50S ribosomal protein L10 [Corynebacterium pseudotuberculosis]